MLFTVISYFGDSDFSQVMLKAWTTQSTKGALRTQQKNQAQMQLPSPPNWRVKGGRAVNNLVILIPVHEYVVEARKCIKFIYTCMNQFTIYGNIVLWVVYIIFLTHCKPSFKFNIPQQPKHLPSRGKLLKLVTLNYRSTETLSKIAYLSDDGTGQELQK
jgi:hypothetical protein